MKNLVSLEGKRIIVTGAGQGIGRAAAEMAIGLGAKVAAVDLNEAAVQDFAAAHGDAAMGIAGNVAEPDLAPAVVQRMVGEWGGVDGLVNNAGITRPAMIHKMAIEQWRDVIDVHLTGSYLFLQAVGSHLLQRAKDGEQAPGAIVNVSSDAGKRGSIGQINYATAKAGLMGMTMSAAREWAKFEIRTNTVCFGVVETPMTEVVRGEKFRDNTLAQIPMGRWSQPDEAVSMICYLLSDAASYVIGQHISVNGGYHIST
ncbi:SDR family oxidoreductase [Pseudooceanicola sp. 216_PA32_1]|uniref:SDR family oxidoreductase n=1 Tax=Pseudooceanicola pacificus TaxID=2676438 RepID=A0A844W5K6_9RHOB|nr:SDR family NAD(P)-dependent oxidoreductase [Pseudooceanicola pacificus]MWB78101.1 SDR family oxidoreductase [Pseudooceanicola pacificus]